MVKHYFLLWVSSTLLLSAAVLGLELLEGNKIRTTEYMGLMDMCPILIVMIGLTAFLLFPLTLVPVSLLIRKWVRISFIIILIYTAAGAAIGRWVFNSLYDERFIREYGLNSAASIILFLTAGLIYAMIDHFSAIRHLSPQEGSPRAE
ncbi:hypothetical protein PAECIP111893_01209 [Paenibacillus plantiphilus]|uniref:Uncharacterized protein n=1 Tax=Paenibacillus plantiphilus TaxID=2905650 RepID=A0ABN8G3P4_9BACL|nr:hypothetical protein [Paenibacillus plantiphilus]CAH1199018.1 hypothetical protein PAECIP111893_01209 [Paenibacillus plantiphilus]